MGGGQVEQIVNKVRVPIQQGTLWRVPDDQAVAIGAGIAAWVSGKQMPSH